MTDTSIRDLRERKQLGQWTVAQAAGLGFSAYVRIESGTGKKTTPEETARVLEVLRGMPDGTRKLGGGRPFNDKEKAAAVKAAREKGESVAAALGQVAPAAAQPEPAAAPEMAPQDVEDKVSDESAPAEQPQETKKERDARKARERRAQKKAEAEAAAAASGLL